MDWFNGIGWLIGFTVLGFAIYGFQFWYEHSIRGYWVDLRYALELDEFWDYYYKEFRIAHGELFNNENFKIGLKHSLLRIAIDRMKKEWKSSESRKEIDTAITEILNQHVIVLKHRGKI